VTVSSRGEVSLEPFPFISIKEVDILLGAPGLSEEEERVMQETFHAGINYRVHFVRRTQWL
jgi:hypothetical protein